MESYEVLQSLSDDDLVDRINAIAPNTNLGVGFYFEELTRRHTARSGDRMERLTVTMTWLTVLSVVTSTAALIVAVIALAQ